MNDYASKHLYSSNRGDSIFEMFLKLSTEKQTDIELLTKALEEHLGERTCFLDVGTGEGSLLAETINKLDVNVALNLHLIEPQNNYSKLLIEKFEAMTRVNSVRVYPAKFEAFHSDIKFDVILSSHVLYHMSSDERHEHITKLLEYLNKDGLLIVILRKKDEVYEFKQRFRTLIEGKDHTSTTIELAEQYFKDKSYSITHYDAEAYTPFPFNSDPEGATQLIEFYLNTLREDIPKKVLNASMQFIHDRGDKLKVADRLLVIKPTK